MQDLRIEDTVMQDQPPRQTFCNKDIPIPLQVGERRFTTWKSTLTQIIFFAGMLSGRWENYTDGVLFMDADGTVFKNILRYLRMGHFPLYFDFTAQSFDYAKYQTLLGEFRGALEVTRETKRFDDITPLKRYLEELSKADDLVITSGWGTQKIHLCPRGWEQHRDRLDSVGRSVRNIWLGSLWPTRRNHGSSACLSRLITPEIRHGVREKTRPL
ncbi:uncharacterized protein PG986_014318 [Apiospora aurea]|uniref:Potassium channel tetramerisation-type BTB domain-containing protein n=1 Tax=Apiospora aurea TaxID=335848 RepID=A0ABR1PT56_9PEZI